MSKHTPGPWTVHDDTDISGIENDPENKCIGSVDVAHVYLRTVPGRHEANARLIAAAPDLLAVLQDVLSTWDSGSEAFPISDIRAAIAKAKGKL